jgi:riboflavin synthase
MFTGIVEEIGEVANLEERDDMILWDGSKGAGTELTVKGDIAMEGAYLGCVYCSVFSLGISALHCTL